MGLRWCVLWCLVVTLLIWVVTLEPVIALISDIYFYLDDHRTQQLVLWVWIGGISFGLLTRKARA